MLVLHKIIKLDMGLRVLHFQRCLLQKSHESIIDDNRMKNKSDLGDIC